MSSGWKDIPIGDACLVTDFVSNGSFASLRENVEYNYEKDYGILVRTTDFTKNWAKDFVYVPKTAFDFLKKSELREGDVVISNVGAPGVTFRVPDLGQPMTLGPNAILVRTHDEKVIRQDYIYRFFESPVGQDMLKGITSGTTQMKFNKTNFRELRVPTPSPGEQQRIVEKLDAAFAALTEAQAHVERNRANARELFESYLNGVFEGKGDGWVRLDEVCEITSMLVDPRLPEHIDLVHVGGGNIESKTGKLIDLKTAREEELKSGKFLFDESMVLYNKIRPYLVKVVRPTFSGLCSADMYPLSPKAGRLDRGYLYYALLSNHFTEYAISGSDRAGMPKVNREHLFAYEFPLPSLKEQQRIAKSLDALLPETQALETTYQQKLAELAGLKKAVLGAAFRGEL
jgi:type I restriction enzyme S subunit